VENAIKYAVSPQETGADITIAAQLVGPEPSHHRLRHRSGLAKRHAATGSGVTFDGGEPFRPAWAWRTSATGWRRPMANEHRFETRRPPEGGFAV
jgi:two-component system LytT family sensor kinase